MRSVCRSCPSTRKYVTVWLNSRSSEAATFNFFYLDMGRIRMNAMPECRVFFLRRILCVVSMSAACLNVGTLRFTRGAVAEQPVKPEASRTIVVFSEGQNAPGVSEQVQAIKRGISNSGNTGFFAGVDSMNYLHLESGEVGLFSGNAEERAYIAQWLQTHIAIMNISLVLTIGEHAAQVCRKVCGTHFNCHQGLIGQLHLTRKLLHMSFHRISHCMQMNLCESHDIICSDPQVVQELLPNSPSVQWALHCAIPTCPPAEEADSETSLSAARMCVDVTLPSMKIFVHILKQLKPTLRSVLLFHDGCLLARRTEAALRAGLSDADSSVTLREVISIRTLQDVEEALHRVQNMTESFVVLPSIACILDTNAKVREEPLILCITSCLRHLVCV